MTPLPAVGIAIACDMRRALPERRLPKPLAEGRHDRRSCPQPFRNHGTARKPRASGGPRTAPNGAVERSADPGRGGVSPAEDELEGGDKAREGCREQWGRRCGTQCPGQGDGGSARGTGLFDVRSSWRSVFSARDDLDGRQPGHRAAHERRVGEPDASRSAVRFQAWQCRAGGTKVTGHRPRIPEAGAWTG